VQHETPLKELSFLLYRLEDGIRGARQTYRRGRIEQQRKVREATKSPNSPRRLGRYLYGRNKTKTPSKSEQVEEAASSPSEIDASTAQVTPTKAPLQRTTDPTAAFISIPSPEQMIEDLRRVAELVIIGENVVTAAQKREDRNRDKIEVDGTPTNVVDQGEAEGGPNLEDHMQLFELFFERKSLEMIVNLLIGESFDLIKHEREDCASGSFGETEGITLSPDDVILVPPLPIATQAIQSLSLLAQNVSRATSLYVILSSNHVNTLIGLPLNVYSAAERGRQVVAQGTSTPQTFTSPPLIEFTTHFVTFLKCLALRMNIQTLQFFLKYPSESPSGGYSQTASSSHFSCDTSSQGTIEDEDSLGRDDSCKQPRKPQLEFPLYERALEFCAAHNDSFVRVTAMNICLNTLRLTTVVDPEVESGDAPDSSELLPDGTLHNAQALPFRERYAIAKYACIPSRVERLVAPIFTKLAERWNSLDEQVREIDSNKSIGASSSLDISGVRNEKAAKAKEKVRRERLIRAFKDKAADLKDELLLLDDVFRVRYK
jgi:uncharacterized protein YdcH (DUF465 family)